MNVKKLKEALQGFVDSVKDMVASVLYRFRRATATDRQREALPRTYSKYRGYKKRYGIAPGDSYEMSGRTVLITAVDGPPDMNATVEYLDVEKGIEYRTGLVNVLRQI